ncbi:type VII toxin-antitoxin system HepT family RNase toxin [Brevibacillus dissolubilis]|uniref:type VII toxin-antitoxin system HepT family RNase toxin n=1 Tax=Brevibacillus dissolubilis TaxID=1844116 RepID=UPI001116390A|nr:DUF86 domain-containing protein [Brevibacillus dissolubilis]
MREFLNEQLEWIDHCVRRVHEVYEDNPDHLHDLTKLESIILNIQRACVASIDLSMHIADVKKWGVPQHSRDAFDMLYDKRIISKELRDRMAVIAGFRAIVIHNYNPIDVGFIEQFIGKNLPDFEVFKNAILLAEF